MPRFAALRLRATAAVLVLLGVGAVPGLAAAQGSGEGGLPAVPSISEPVQRFVQDGEVAGAVTLVASPNRILHLDATGKADLASGRPMEPDTIFWIASMSKPITA